MQLRLGAYELRKHGAPRFDWRDPYHLAVGLSWPGFVALLGGIDLAINAVFALLYAAVPGCLSLPPGSGFAGAFFFSVETLATVGYGQVAPVTLYGHIVSTAEIFAGMAFIALGTGLTFVRFSRPRARIRWAQWVTSRRGWNSAHRSRAASYPRPTSSTSRAARAAWQRG